MLGLFLFHFTVLFCILPLVPSIGLIIEVHSFLQSGVVIGNFAVSLIGLNGLSPGIEISLRVSTEVRLSLSAFIADLFILFLSLPPYWISTSRYESLSEVLCSVWGISVDGLLVKLSFKLADRENIQLVVIDDLIPIVIRQVFQVLRGHAFIGEQLRQYRVFSQAPSNVFLYRNILVLSWSKFACIRWKNWLLSVSLVLVI